MSARSLFRTDEPILKLNGRENYKPMRVEPFLVRASLYRAVVLGRAQLVKGERLVQ